jgi:acetyltransferase-like isoleucine patch superfamily enzyme
MEMTTTNHLQAGAELINADSTTPIVGKNVHINGLIDCCCQVTIGDNVFSGHDVMILTGSHDPNKFGEERMKSSNSKPIVIEEGVWLGTRCIILGGVTIGANAVVGAGAVVTKDVPPFALVAGVPARVVKYYNGLPQTGEINDDCYGMPLHGKQI